MSEREMKVFRASVPAPDVVDEMTYPFALEFTYPDGRVVQHTFGAVIDRNNASANFAIISMARRDDRGRQVTDLNGVFLFLEKVLPREDYSRLSVLIDDQSIRMNMEMLVDVFSWLCEEITGRPTMRSTPSSSGPFGTGTPLTDSVLAGALTSSPSRV